LRACLKDSHKRLSLSTKAFIFGKVLQDKDFMNGMLFKQSITIMRIFYHDTVFPNHKFLAVMDERGGTLNYATVEVIRDLERSYWVSCYVFKSKGFKAILLSKTDLHRAAKRIQAVADGIVPFSRFSTPSREGIKFNVIQVVILLIKSCGLEEAAKHRLIDICSSADVAPITKSVGGLTQGLSVNDRGAISPYTKRPLCLSEMRGTNWDDEDAPITLAKRDDVQSRNEAYPLTVMLGSETKLNMEHLGENYNILTQLGADALAVNVAYKPFEVTHKGDMSLQWKITKKGCATKKVNEKCCMCCTCKGKDMHKLMEIICAYYDEGVSPCFKP
jgi:hypothetical protein